MTLGSAHSLAVTAGKVMGSHSPTLPASSVVGKVVGAKSDCSQDAQQQEVMVHWASGGEQAIRATGLEVTRD